jgi:solute carrier organic anion transporter family, member 5A
LTFFPQIFTNCSCVNPNLSANFSSSSDRTANPSPCPLDCTKQFYLFLFVICINKFIGGTEGATNFLMGLRCVEEKDKAVSIGLTSTIIKFFAVIPSPIVFGYIFDRACLFWGKTCSKKGNCWLYDNDLIKYSFNVTAGTFLLIGTFWDMGTWYYSKNVKIFDEKKENKDED